MRPLNPFRSSWLKRIAIGFLFISSATVIDAAVEDWLCDCGKEGDVREDFAMKNDLFLWSTSVNETRSGSLTECEYLDLVSLIVWKLAFGAEIKLISFDSWLLLVETLGFSLLFDLLSFELCFELFTGASIETFSVDFA